MPQPTIILHTEGIRVTALPQSTAADQVLRSSRARHEDDGIYVLDDDTPSLDQLADLARRRSVHLVRSDRPFIGSTARSLADALPGTWLPESYNLNRSDWVLAEVWDRGPLAAALADSLVTSVAVIHNPASEMEFMVAEHPATHDLLVGPKTPVLDFPSTTFLATHVPTPNGIRASSVADATQQLIPLVPALDRDLCEGRIQRIAADLGETPTGSTATDETLGNLYLDHGPRLARRVLDAGTLLTEPEEDDLLNRLRRERWPIDRDETQAWRVDAHRIISLARAAGLGLPQPPEPAPPIRSLLPAPPTATNRTTGRQR
ncbi:hypothetical protein [Streptomyces rubiginosohelvolus]|uniref:Uncharacterized protein n=1 Tax=Streptomyces rubiginosohelvolus TaxID=67362 RepID=A0ABW6ETI5_9ACTN